MLRILSVRVVRASPVDSETDLTISGADVLPDSDLCLAATTDARSAFPSGVFSTSGHVPIPQSYPLNEHRSVVLT